jgi:[ribosomal protein S5]-alanine N-acetyltransferase
MRRLEMIYFESSRLVFRDWKEEYLDDFRKMNNDSQVMEYFPNILSYTETDSLYQRIQEEFAEYGYGLYAVEIKDANEFIGFIGFHWAPLKFEFAPCIEIGWRLKKEAWRKGYATEGARECLSHGFNCLGFNEVYSFTSKVNLRSENVMKKIGMVKKLEFNYPQIDLSHILSKHVLYKITSLQYSNLIKS